MLCFLNIIYDSKADLCNQGRLAFCASACDKLVSIKTALWSYWFEMSSMLSLAPPKTGSLDVDRSIMIVMQAMCLSIFGSMRSTPDG